MSINTKINSSNSLINISHVLLKDVKKAYTSSSYLEHF